VPISTGAEQPRLLWVKAKVKNTQPCAVLLVKTAQILGEKVMGKKVDCKGGGATKKQKKKP
jgi:hypothetical protein